MAEFDHTLDIILVQLGQYGKYQFFLLILFSLASLIHAGTRFSFVFAAKDLIYRCEIPECGDSSTNFNPSWLSNAVPFSQNQPEKCEKYFYLNKTSTCNSTDFDKSVREQCDRFVYKTTEKTILNEFSNMQCNENLWKLTIVGTVNSFGQFLGLPLAGYLSDKYGRKTVLIWGMTLCGIFGIIKAFATSYSYFIAFEFLDSAFASGAYSSGYILGVELMGPKGRVVAGTIICCFYAAGEVFTGGVAWAFQSWRPFLITIYALNLLLPLYYWLTPESLRWLLTNNKTEEVRKILKKAARINGKTISEDALEKLCIVRNTEATTKPAKSPIQELLKSPTLIIRFITSSFCWITVTFLFYGLTLSSVSLSGNGYLDFMLVGLIELPAYFLTWLLVDRLGRRLFLHVSYLSAAIACGAFIFIPSEMYWLRLSVYLLGKFWSTAAFSTCYILSSELFPTHLRNSMIAANSMFGRIGSMVAPQMPLLEKVWKPFPLTLFTILAVIAAFLSLTFPETTNINLPDSVQEAEEVGKKS